MGATSRALDNSYSRLGFEEYTLIWNDGLQAAKAKGIFRLQDEDIIYARVQRIEAGFVVSSFVTLLEWEKQDAVEEFKKRAHATRRVLLRSRSPSRAAYRIRGSQFGLSTSAQARTSVLW